MNKVQTMRIYIAAPLFNEAERGFNEHIEYAKAAGKAVRYLEED